MQYIGEAIRQVVADRREQQYEDEGVGSCYLFRLDKEVIVDATRRGGMARFMNHCCEPCAYARVITTDEEKGLKHIIIFAARGIQEGEEITYDYKFPIEDEKLKCYCGAPRCNGSMN
jgi:histone-lysine N-methyltransferase SETD1